MTIATILLILALIAFIMAAANVPSPVNLVGLGLALVTLAQLLGNVVLR